MTSMTGETSPSRMTVFLSGLSALFNMLNTTVGASLLAMPYSYRTTGIATSTLLLLFVSIMIVYTYYILVRVSEMTGAKSFQEISEKSFGEAFGFISETAVFLFCFGCLVAYVVVISDLSTALFVKILGRSIFANPFFVTAIVLLLLVFPMCCLRRIELIATASGISILAAMVVILVVTGKCIEFRIQNPIEAKGLVWFGLAPDHILASISLFSFALGAHQSLLPAYHELRNPSALKMTWICAFNVVLCFLTYSFFGIIGYLYFGISTQDNILKNLANDAFGYIAKGSVAIIIVMTYPLMNFCCRNSVERVFFAKSDFSWIRWISIASIISIVAYGMGLLIPKISIIFSFSGASTGVWIMYVFPCSVYMKLESSIWKRLIALLTCIIAICLGIAAIVSLLLGFIK